MAQLLAEIIPLALAAAVNPGMILFALAILLSPTRPLARAIAFVLGAAATSAAVGILTLVGASSVAPGRRPNTPSTAESVVFIVVGVLLLVASGWQALRRKPPSAESVPARTPQRFREAVSSPGMVFWIGAGFMLTNVKALLLYAAAVRDIVNAQVGAIPSVILMAGVLVIMLAGMVLPIVIYALDREKAARTLSAVRAWISAHAHVLAIIVGFVLGLYCLARGISGLRA